MIFSSCCNVVAEIMQHVSMATQPCRDGGALRLTRMKKTLQPKTDHSVRQAGKCLSKNLSSPMGHPSDPQNPMMIWRIGRQLHSSRQACCGTPTTTQICPFKVSWNDFCTVTYCGWQIRAEYREQASGNHFIPKRSQLTRRPGSL